MRLLHCVLVVTLLLSSTLTAYSQTDPASVDAFLKSTLQARETLRVATTGDLNGDGRADWVGVIHRQPPDSSPSYQLYVLVQLPNGGYRVAEKSLEEEIPGMGCCWLEDLQIRRGGIYVQNNAKTASTMEAATHQFKLYKGQWQLVGLKIYFTDHSPDAPLTRDTDMNLLTGLVIEKTQKGDRKPFVRRRYKKFTSHLLKDFDFSNGFGIEE